VAETRDIKSLGDIAEINPESIKHRSAPPEIRYIDIAAVDSGSIDETAVRTIMWPDAPSRARRLVRAGDIIVSTVRPYLRTIARVPPSLDGAVASTGFAVIRARPSEINSDLLWHALTSDPFFEHLVERQSGTMYPAVKPGDVADAVVPVPPRDQQEELAALLSAAEQTARAATAVKISLRELAAARRAGVFGAPPTSAPLTDCVELAMGRQRAPKHQLGDSIVSYLRAGNVKDGFLELGDVLSMNFNPREQEKYGLQPGDVMVTEGCGSLDQIGASARWSAEIDGVICFQNTLLRLRAIPGVSHPSFVYHWARFAFERGVFADVATGTSIFHIGAERAAGMAFPVMGLDQQIAIGAELDAIESSEHKATWEATAATELRRALFSELVFGTGEMAARLEPAA
jgi:type I restriction enzyme S subunit